MGNPVYWFISRFIANNNFRLAVLWIVILIHFLFNIFIFGIFGMAEVKQFSNFSETRQQLYNHSFHKKFATNRELYPVNYYLHWLRTVSWEIWFILLVAGMIYFPIALREEVGRAWVIARQRTSAWKDMPDPVTDQIAPTVPKRKNSFTQVFVFMREFIASIVAELLGERVMR